MSRKVILTVFFALVALCAPALAYADIYRWEDERGVLHFTDDIKKVPIRYRDKAAVQKTPAPSTDTSAPEGAGKVEEKRDSADELYGDYTLQWWLETFRKKKNEVSQAVSLIETKKKFVQMFESGRRFGQTYEQADVEKYNLYKAELPADEQRLADLNDEVSELKRKAKILGVPREIIEQ